MFPLFSEKKSFNSVKEASRPRRTLSPASHRDGAHTIIDNVTYLDFSTNDYLGLSRDPQIKDAFHNEVAMMGATGSRLLSGDYESTHALEKIGADHLKKESGLLFNSGYQLNLGCISALTNRHDIIFADKKAHASLIDGCQLSRAKTKRFQHNNTAHLETLLHRYRNKYKKALIITEALFSMDGDTAPLSELIELKKKYQCELYIDEAHSYGIFGEEGDGLCASLGLSKDIDYVVATFGKAAGLSGAMIATSQDKKDWLIGNARSFIYSTAMPLPMINGLHKAIERIKACNDRRLKIKELSTYFRAQCSELGINTMGNSQIIPLLIGDDDATIAVSKALKEKGIFAPPIRPPTVPQNQSRIRVSITHHHTTKMLNQLIGALIEENI